MKLVEEYLLEWTTQDGGGMLDQNDRGPPLKGCSLERTANENPILFLVQAAMELCKKDDKYFVQYKHCYENHMASTQLEPGLHSRRCGDRYYMRQSHDNIVAMLIGGWYFKSHYAENVFQYGIKHAWCFNVASPGDYDVKCQLQGGDIALAYLATNRRPLIWDMAWLSVGLALPKAFNLSDLRLEFLKQVELKPLEKGILSIGASIHYARRGPRQKWVQNYYVPGHPFRRSVEGKL